jgi:predicted rRNA pseudouridine synthase
VVAEGPSAPPEVAERLRAGAFLLVDKPRGPSSHQVTAWVRDMIGVPLAGHAGTLDPHVSGVLWIGVGPSLKLLPMLLELPKRYVGVLTLHGPVPAEALATAVAEFTGPVFQTPPVRSAVKRRRRIRTIHRLTVLDRAGTNVLIDCVVDSGTYIRSLAVDLGDALGVGAHLAELRRVGTGPFGEAEAVSLAALKDATLAAEAGNGAPLLAMLHPMARVLGEFPRLTLREGAASAIAHGADLARGGIRSVEGKFAEGDSVVLVDEGGRLLAVGRALRDSEHLGGEGWVVDATRVFSDPARYPPTWQRAHPTRRGPPAPVGNEEPSVDAGG